LCLLLILSSFVLAGSVDMNFKNDCTTPYGLWSVTTGFLTEIPAGGSYSYSPFARYPLYRNGSDGSSALSFSFNSVLGIGHKYFIDVSNGFDVAVQIKPTAILAPTLTCGSADCAKTPLNPNGWLMEGTSLLGGNFNVTFCPP
ncbi:hypothetical protein PMAYCL1PPCAC_26188, partial [Pristionchus mayeri]